MQEPNRTELLNRLGLMEQMIAEGRSATERWGWVFLLWGTGPLIAMWWEAQWPHAALAWPVVMGICVVVNGAVLAARKRRGDARTTAMRSVGAIWRAVGVTVLLLALGAAVSRALDLRSLCVALFALAAVAHGASTLILRWLPQSLAAIVWWTALMGAFVVPANRLHVLAAAALLLGNVAFGAWLTYREWSRGDE